MMNGICASIITFNPNIKRLEYTIKSIYNQVDCLVFIDNNSNNIDEIMVLVNKLESINIIKNNKNEGIAKALNQAKDYALSENKEWLLTLDQDSICPLNLINEYLRYTNNDNIGILTLAIKKNGILDIPTTNIEYVERCITSGSLMNLRVLDKVGGFDEAMFIDWVDHDICKKERNLGYLIVKVNSIYLDHELGPQKKVAISVLLNKLFHTKVYNSPHSPLRTYYYVRNGIYFIKKYKSSMSASEYKYIKYEINMCILRGFILGHNKIKYLSSILNGIRDGKRLNYKER